MIAGAGSAIFLHVDTGKPTSGCVAVAEADVKRILGWLDPGKSPRIVMGPEPWLLAPSSASPAAVAGPVGLTALRPARILDTRDGNGGRNTPLGPGETMELQVRGRGGVPADADVAIVNLTAADATSATYLRVTPSGTNLPDPIVSNLNLHAGGSRANLVMARIGSNGRVRIYNHAGSTNVVADVMGFGSPGQLGGVDLVPPRRLLDTRDGLGIAGGAKAKLGARSLLDMKVAGAPPGATAAIINLTATGPTEPTYVAAFAGATQWNGTSTLNLGRNETVPNLAIVPLGPDATVRLLNHAGAVDLVVDLFGFIVPNSGSRYVPAVQPNRVLDTREGLGRRGQLPHAARMTVSIPGYPTGVTGAIFNLTGTNATMASNLRSWREGVESVPLISNVNLEPQVPSANLAIAQTGETGGVQMYNAAGNVDVVVDLQGWLVN